MVEKKGKSIKLLGQDVKYSSTKLDIKSLQFYETNPRIYSKVHGLGLKGKDLQSKIQEELFALDSTKALFNDIRTNGGLIEPVWVWKGIVVEGNSRFCCYRRLYAKLKDLQWRKIPCNVISGDMAEEQLFHLLGTFHIKGKAEWQTYEKAFYIYRMSNELGKGLDVIASELGKSKKSVETMVQAYQVMSKKYLLGERKNDTDKFSYFLTLLGSKKYSAMQAVEPLLMEQFITWIGEGRVKSVTEVRRLSEIVTSNKAYRIFRKSDPGLAFQNALSMLYIDNPEKVDPVYKGIREFRELLRDIEVDKVKYGIENDDNKSMEVQLLVDEVRKFANKLGLKKG